MLLYRRCDEVAAVSMAAGGAYVPRDAASCALKECGVGASGRWVAELYGESVAGAER